ncbi:hypothetical protein [Chlamydia sp. 17-3921]|uniref:hypothetical protein n=1 Tax=Chlamydia sp. 17-3921 TaxID=2675798 RepID=UPI00191AD14B|nr:hypothetical protein [Chlamydia sp. 17-3921]
MSTSRPISALSGEGVFLGQEESNAQSSGGGIQETSLRDISLKLNALQSALVGFFPQQPHQQPLPYFYPSPPVAHAFSHDELLSSPVIKSQTHQISQIQLNLAALKTEVAALKTTVSHAGTPSGVCSGAMALTALLLAISFVAIIIIILAALGLAGILPQFALLLENHSNLIWAMVSASIVTVICLISVLCVTLIRHKPTPTLLT